MSGRRMRVLVTGAGSGIGLGIAEHLASRGHAVCLTDLDAATAEQGAAHLRSRGYTADSLALDVTSATDIDAVVAALEPLGPDLLVNNAGLQHVSPIEEFPTEKFELLVRVMLVAPFLAVKRVFPAMKRQRYGRILNLASINGLVGFAGKAAYNSAKHGLLGLTKVAALEGASHGITVNALCPG